MNIIQVNNTDLMGCRFNGHDLQITLNQLGHQVQQFVIDKQGRQETTIPITNFHEKFVDTLLKNLEYELGMANLLSPWSRKIEEHPLFNNADIVHYHLIHNQICSILDIPTMLTIKPSVWTVHDPWIVTGQCIYPKECEKWKTGCRGCKQLNDKSFSMKIDKAHEVWKIKKETFKAINPYIIVSTQFMEDYIKQSPLTEHFNHIYRVPFGIDVDKFSTISKQDARNAFGIPSNHFVLAFREDEQENKGVKYIIKMLDELRGIQNITLLTVGNKVLPVEIKGKYNTIQLGWIHGEEIIKFYAACDVFLMPSLVESFGLMAIEAMAAGKPVVVFENTVLPEITFAPECGIAVQHKGWKELSDVVKRLMATPNEVYKRGKLGRKLAKEYYSYERYVKEHIRIYEEIVENEKMSRG